MPTMPETTEAARQYSRANAGRFQDELFEMLRIPSLSGDPAHAGDVRRMAEWLADHLRQIGVDNVAIMPTGGHPVVYGEWLGAPLQLTSGRLCALCCSGPTSSLASPPDRSSL